MCIGSRMGLILIKTALISFLRNHQVRVCAKTVKQPTYDPKSCVLHLNDGVYLELVRDNLSNERINLLKNVK